MNQEDDPLMPVDGCTGYYREDPDWGDVLTHPRACPVHTFGCSLECQVTAVHTREPGCQLHIPPTP